ncbi:MAG TPA: APC family permease [Anaerolineales bacterium]|nr:APC family permease [Anaerolineales bacterium]
MTVQDAAQMAAQQAGDVFSRKASGLTRVVSPWTALAYSFVAPNITQASFYLLWSVTLFAGANMQIAILFMISLLPFAAIYVYFSASMPRSGGEYIYISRVLTPFLGFIASWTLTIVGLNWQGNNTNYVINWGFGHTFMQLGLVYKNQAMFSLGTEMAKTQGSWLVWIMGTISLMLSFYVIYRGIKLFMRFVWAAMILTWVMLAVYAIVMLSVNPTVVAAGMKAVQNIDYQNVLAQARSLGWQPGLYALLPTVLAGMTFMNLTCLGSTYSANIAGEIKRVDKAQPLAQYGSIILFIVYYEIFTYVTYHGVGVDLLQAISKLNSQGADVPIFKAFPQIPYLMVYATQNPFLLLIGGPFAWGLINWVGAMGLAFAPVRNLFAYSFDGMLPPKFNEVNRRGSPVYAVLLGFVIAWFQFTVNCITPLLSAYQVYTITIWFFGWMFLSIAAIVFPWRRKDIWDKAPEVTRQKLLGAPAIVVWGVVGFIISIFVMYATLLPFFQGASVYAQLPALGVSFGFYMILPIILYFVAIYMNKRRGVSLDKRFREVPPD